jgi:hypothetical protein
LTVTIWFPCSVKGCWNDELFTALEEQLFRNYMIRLRAQVGIYLAGWFDTGKWDTDDSRLDRVPKITIEAAKGQHHLTRGLPQKDRRWLERSSQPSSRSSR